MHPLAAAPCLLEGPPLAPRPASVNVGEFLARTAARRPDQAAVVESDGHGWHSASYAELAARADSIALGLSELGLARGERAALFVRPGADLIAITYALFLIGAVPVVVDPGLGAAAMARCLARTRPKAFLGVPRAHALRRLHARQLGSVAIDVVVGPRRFPFARTLAQLERAGRGRCTPAATRADETAAILFTSGSTGPAKGVVYHHGAFAAQIEALRRLCRIEPGDVDLACFPLFALFDAALETTCVVPRLDPARPARCDPAAIAGALTEHGCSYTFGSPAIWRRVVPFARERGLAFPALRGAWIAGAPVPLALVESFRALLGPGGEVHTPYGATECLPVSSASGAELLGLRASIEGGGGSCVGRAAPGVALALAPVHDDPIERASEGLFLPRGEQGEICVRGPAVTRAYFEDERADRLSKIQDGTGAWHRTGDVGWIDDQGRLWIVGRKAHRIETRDRTYHPVPVENVCDLHPRVAHSALVGAGPHGSEEPVLFVEPVPGAFPRTRAARERFARELAELRAARLRPIGPNAVPAIARTVFRRSFPVDARHNAKIRREELRASLG
jgi:acyl-CoA synthetase (AMP-forming)/AMP-acid ligase II